MNRDDIIRMAKEVADISTDIHGREEFIFDSYGIERFANLVAAAEREACVKVCEWEAAEWELNSKSALRCAAAIRARGQE